MRELNRVPVSGNPGDYKSYSLKLPKATHYRPGVCGEVNVQCVQTDALGNFICSEWHCSRHAHGWKTMVDVSTQLGQRQEKYIETQAGRSYTRAQAGTLITYVFAAGQQCFSQHQVALEREPIFIVRDGDYRGNPSGRKMQHANGQDWIDDFGEHQEKLADRLKEG